MEENSKRRSVAVITVFLLLLLLGLGYAALTTTLNINGNATVKKQTWDIHFASPTVTTGSVKGAGGADIIPTVSGTTASYEISLEKPGDFYEFTINVVNDGTIDAKIGATPTINGLSSEMAKIIDYKVTYSDGTDIAANDTLDAKSSKTMKVRVAFKTDISPEDLNGTDFGTEEDGSTPKTSVTLNLTYSVNYIQA